MNDLLEQLDALTVTVAVASGSITGQLKNRTRVKLSFADTDDYDDADVSTLERHLAELLVGLMAGRRQGFYHAVSQRRDSPITGEEPPLTSESRNFRLARDSVELVGDSPDGRISIDSVGMREFSVNLSEDVIAELDYSQFASMFERAVADLWKEYRTALKVIRDDAYSSTISNPRS